ncbi:MAG: class I SAM-dependent methyltransferase [Spirochaetia bacterium]|jgi:2-polyprenyl-3-methyl-5-hydroxy-6-metoxy-1,4-benzoquinol methylase|nr:class I SAM-dependent methyltransferase [Spirochaetia bacterium]
MFYSKFSKDYEQIFPFNKKVYSFLKGYLPSNNTNILDIGCATGHYCGRFAADGYKITGIDLDSDMIRTAVNTYPVAEFKVLNLTDISALTSKFGLVYSTGNVLAHVSLDDFKSFLFSLKKIIPNRGIWIYQVINWDYILKQDNYIFSEIETEDKLFLRHYSDITVNTLVFNTELKNKSDGKVVFKDKVTMYPVPSEHYITMHQETGFELLGHFSDYGKSVFDRNDFSADIYVFKLKK